MKRDALILAVRGVYPAVSRNVNPDNSDFIFAGIGFGCLFACAYCYTNLNKMWHLNVAPFTLYANIDETLKYLGDHQRQQSRQVWYDFSCNNDSIAEGAFFSSTAKMIETIAQTENAFGICTTKATNIDYLLNLNHNGKTTIKLTLAPPRQINRFEYFTGSLTERIDALNRLKNAGYNVGINFSPIVLRANWLEDYTDLFRYIDANLTNAAKENLVGEAFFYTHRKVLVKKLPVFRRQFSVLHNPNEYPTKPKRMGVHHYRNLKKPIEDFREALEKYVPYFHLRYIF
jgi:DNA repair photolyase